MQDSINSALVGAADQLESEISLAPALPVISELADIEDSRLLLEGCVEQMTMADGSVVDVLEAEQTYRDWRANHTDLVPGHAVTGDALVDEIRATMEMLNNPSMESDLVQQLKRTFFSMSTAMKTFGKNLVDIKAALGTKKTAIAANPVLIGSPAAYGFLTRDNKAVDIGSTSLDEDIKFIDLATEHYQRMFDKSAELGKRFREACTSDSNENIREAIDFFDDNMVDRSQLEDLTKFHLLGNRTVYLDKHGYPQFKKSGNIWKAAFGESGGLMPALAKKKVHGFAIGGPLKAVSVPGMNDVAAKRQVNAAIKASGGETAVGEFMSTLDKAILLNNRAVRFAQMAASMSERVQRLSADMEDAYDHVNDEKVLHENLIRIRELRSLYRTGRRTVAQYMFLGKAIATMMEDHASYVYRNITLIANDVLKKASK
ncbi:hypothetical protein PA10_00098 [Pseudomonas phage pPa_SNUABM_DT01]|nr:hypothetical protein PA10_00098 [Pseudomonas phage pPa_SNUABM_DT01]